MIIWIYSLFLFIRLWWRTIMQGIIRKSTSARCIRVGRILQVLLNTSLFKYRLLLTIYQHLKKVFKLLCLHSEKRWLISCELKSKAPIQWFGCAAIRIWKSCQTVRSFKIALQLLNIYRLLGPTVHSKKRSLLWTNSTSSMLSSHHKFILFIFLFYPVFF